MTWVWWVVVVPLAAVNLGLQIAQWLVTRRLARAHDELARAKLDLERARSERDCDYLRIAGD